LEIHRACLPHQALRERRKARQKDSSKLDDDAEEDDDTQRDLLLATIQCACVQCVNHMRYHGDEMEMLKHAKKMQQERPQTSADSSSLIAKQGSDVRVIYLLLLWFRSVNAVLFFDIA